MYIINVYIYKIIIISYLFIYLFIYSFREFLHRINHLTSFSNAFKHNFFTCITLAYHILNKICM